MVLSRVHKVERFWQGSVHVTVLQQVLSGGASRGRSSTVERLNLRLSRCGFNSRRLHQIGFYPNLLSIVKSDRIELKFSRFKATALLGLTECSPRWGVFLMWFF